MTVTPSCNSDLTVESQIFAGFMHMGIPALTSSPSLKFTHGCLSVLLLGPKQAAQKLHFELQRIKRGQEHQPFFRDFQTTVEMQL